MALKFMGGSSLIKKLLRLFFKAALLAVIVITVIALWPENGDFSVFEDIQGQYTDSFALSEEINANPATGLHITVPKAATDRQLQLVASRLSTNQILELSKNDPDEAPTGPIMAAYEISLGLLSEERLMKPMLISFNLKETGIPQEEWQNLMVYRVEGEGPKIPVTAKLYGEELKLFTTKNSTFVIVGVPTGATAFYYVVGLYGKGTMSYMAMNSIMEDGTTYRLLWPEGLKADTRQLTRQIKAKLINVNRAVIHKIKTMKLSAEESYLGKVAEILREIRNSEDFKDLNRWTGKFANSSGFPPHEVKQTEKALKDIHAFFTNVKGLPPKNVLGVDIVIRTKETWPHPEDPKAVAMTANPRGAVLPYVDINAENIQDSDELYLNLTHELFHVLQEDYYYIQGMSSAFYLPFLEGTAVMLEYEAAKYFSDPNLPGKARISSKNKPTDRDYYITLSNPMEDSDAELIQRHHGYTMSHFLEFLRDRHANDKEKYLKKLMDSFGGTRSFSTNQALCRSVAMKPGDFSQVFIQYCSDNAQKMADSIPAERSDEARNAGKEALFKDVSQTINPQQPCYEWDYPVEKPLACEFRFIEIHATGVGAKDRRLLINDEALKRQSVKLRFSTDGNKNWHEYTSGGIAIDAAGINKLTLQRISPMLAKSWLLSASGKTQAAVMYPPEIPLVENLTDGKISVTIKESILARNGMIKGYRIYIKAPGSADPEVHNVDKASSVNSFSLPDFEKVSTDQRLYKMPYEIYYREIAAQGGENGDITGPESEKILYYPVEDLLAGIYTGKCAFDATVPESLKQAKNAALEEVANLSFAYMAQSGGNKDAVKNTEKKIADTAKKPAYQSSSLAIEVHDKDGNYKIDAQLPGMHLKGFLQNAGTAQDKWATRYIITDTKWNKLGYMDISARDGGKPGQEALLIELKMSNRPDKFEMVVNDFAQFTGYFYKDGKKPKWKDSELLLKELFP